MEWLVFIKQYMKKPGRTGAIAPSSNALALKMIEDIDFANCRCIVEYGGGTGSFTEKVVANKKPDTLFLVFEYNDTFHDILKNKFSAEKNVVIINDSAEHVERYLKNYGIAKADYIISGLPFASLPADLSRNILSATGKALHRKGKFITFQYSLFKLKLFKSYFRDIGSKRVLRNLPPAYVFTFGDFMEPQEE